MDPVHQLAQLESDGLLPGLDEVGHELLTIEDRRQRGHTGERFAKDEARLNVALRLLGLGIDKREIAKLCGTSTSVIVQIAHRHRLDVVGEKKELAAMCRAGAQRLVRRIVECADEIPLGQAAVSAGILIDKAGILDGDLAAAPVFVQPAITHDSLNAYLASLRSVGPVCEGASAAQKGEGSRPGAVIDVVYDAAPRGIADSESAQPQHKA